MDNNFFFAYGLLRDLFVVKEIIGHSPLGSQGAILENFDLGYQTLDQIPPEPRQILSQIWGNSFKAYTIYPGKGIVSGTIWSLEEKDLALIDKWEFVDLWRERISVTAKAFNGNIINITTTKIFDNQELEKYVDSINYENILNQNVKKISLEEEFNKKEIKKIKEAIKLIKNNQ